MVIAAWRVNDRCVRCGWEVERWTGNVPWLFCLRCLRVVERSLFGWAAT